AAARAGCAPSGEPSDQAERRRRAAARHPWKLRRFWQWTTHLDYAVSPGGATQHASSGEVMGRRDASQDYPTVPLARGGRLTQVSLAPESPRIRAAAGDHAAPSWRTG